MLGAEREILANHVAAGQVQLVFWPVLDHGDSENATAAALCAGEQDPLAFWRYHDRLFEEQREVFGAGRDYYVATAAALGLDGAAFEACYDGGAAHDLARTLDAARRDRGIFSRPSFAIAPAGGEPTLLIGAQPYEVFAQTFESLLP